MPIYQVNRSGSSIIDFDQIHESNISTFADLTVENFILSGELEFRNIIESIDLTPEHSGFLFEASGEGFGEKIKGFFESIKNFIVKQATRFGNFIKDIFNKIRGKGGDPTTKDVPVSKEDVEAAKKDPSPEAQNVVNNVKDAGASGGDKKDKTKDNKEKPDSTTSNDNTNNTEEESAPKQVVPGKVKLELVLKKLREGKIDQATLESHKFHMHKGSAHAVMNYSKMSIPDYSKIASQINAFESIINSSRVSNDGSDNAEESIKKIETEIINKILEGAEDVVGTKISDKIHDPEYIKDTSNMRNDLAAAYAGPEVVLDAKCADDIENYVNNINKIIYKDSSQIEGKLRGMVKEAQDSNLVYLKKSQDAATKFASSTIMKLDPDKLNKGLALMGSSINRINAVYHQMVSAIVTNLARMREEYNKILTFLLRIPIASLNESAHVRYGSSNIFESIRFI